MNEWQKYVASEGRTLVQRLRSLKPEVPEVIYNQAKSDVERHLLEQGSYLDQQNVLIGDTLERVLEQTMATNGRVTNQEAISRTQQIVLDKYKEQTKQWHTFLKWFLASLAFLGVPVADIFFHWLAHKLGILGI